MTKKTITDSRVRDDSALLDRMRKKCSLDFVKWTDDPVSRAASVPTAKRKGHRSTLHSVSGPMLANLPDAVLDRPVAALEFSIDFVAKLASNREEQLGDLIATYEMLHRRLAPWIGRFVGGRIARSIAEGHCDPVTSAMPLSGTNPDGSVWVKGSLKRLNRWLIRPRSSGGLLAPTASVYFGFKPVTSWAYLPYPPKPRAQVRLYIKVTDNNKKALLPGDWTTRMEVTLNGTPLEAVLGVRKMRDLQTADMKKLFKEYLRLASPQINPKLTKVKTRSRVIKPMLERHLQQIAVRDAASALAGGNFTKLEDGLIDFPPVATLDRAISHSANSFRRSVARVKTLKRSPSGLVLASS